jgi:hypothetical protein
MSASCWRDQARGLPGQLENDAAAEVFEQRQSEPKLFPRSCSAVNLTVASRAGGMQPDENGIGEITRLDDDGDRTATHCVMEHDKAGGRARVAGHLSVSLAASAA